VKEHAKRVLNYNSDMCEHYRITYCLLAKQFVFYSYHPALPSRL